MLKVHNHGNESQWSDMKPHKFTKWRQKTLKQDYCTTIPKCSLFHLATLVYTRICTRINFFVGFYSSEHRLCNSACCKAFSRLLGLLSLNRGFKIGTIYSPSYKIPLMWKQEGPQRKTLDTITPPTKGSMVFLLLFLSQL